MSVGSGACLNLKGNPKSCLFDCDCKASYFVLSTSNVIKAVVGLRYVSKTDSFCSLSLISSSIAWAELNFYCAIKSPLFFKRFISYWLLYANLMSATLKFVSRFWAVERRFLKNYLRAWFVCFRRAPCWNSSSIMLSISWERCFFRLKAGEIPWSYSPPCFLKTLLYHKL